MIDSNCTYQFVDLLDISIRFGPSGALVSKKVCVTASLGADSFEKASISESNHVLEDCYVFLLHRLQLIIRRGLMLKRWMPYHLMRSLKCAYLDVMFPYF